MEEKMKKKIALFLIAALLCAGLIVGCGDEKKPEVIPPDDGPTEYTVTFDTDGGTPATIAPIKVESGKTVGAAKWPDDPSKDGYIFDGWFEGATKYEYSTAITKDVTLKAKYSLRPEYALDLGGFTWLNNNNQKGWRANGTDNVVTDLPIEELKYAKYLVLHTKGGNSDSAFGDISVIIQSNGESGWPWNSTNIGGAAFDRTDDNFIVIDISKIKGGSALSLCSQGKFIIQYYGGGSVDVGLGLEAGYITNKNLSAKPDDAVEFKATVNEEEIVYGYVTADNILGITTPTTFYTVTFNTDGGAPAVPAVKVGEGKSLGVKYPTWVTKDGNDFLGWINKTTVYTASTPVTADITLKALWEEVPLPTFNTAADITFLGKTNLGTNAIGFGSGEYQGNPPLSLDLFTDSKYLVLAFLGSNANRDGFGGLQVAVQSSIAPSAWYQTNAPDWTSFANRANEFVFVVVPLDNLLQYTTISTNSSLTGAKFVLNSGFTNYKGAWLTSEDLDTDEFTAYGDKFYLTKTLGIE